MELPSPCPVVGYERRVRSFPLAGFTAIEQDKPVSVIAVEDHPVYLITTLKGPGNGAS